MQPIRVLVVSHCMDRNGAESLIMNIYRSLDREKVQFDFLLHCNYRSSFEDEIETLGGIIHKVPPYLVYNHMSYVRTLDSFFGSHPEYKIVHGHLFNRIEYLKVAKRHGLVTIAHCHASTNGSGISALVADFLHRNINKYADYRFACSKQAGRWLYGKDVSFRVIPNAIDTSRFSFDREARKRTRIQLGIPQDSIVLGHVGRFLPVKNQSFILDVFAEYLNINSNSVLLLVGEGPLMEEIHQKAEKLGIVESVIFSGSRQDVPELMCAMDYFIFPSLFEGLPVTLIEAQCTGLPCLVSDNITEECDVTDLISRQPLTSQASTWASKIIPDSQIEREQYHKIVGHSDFEIKKVAGELQDLYLKLQRERPN